MKEEIRLIEWTNGRYGISNLGKVYSFVNSRGNPLKTPKVKKQHVMPNGYMQISLRVGKKDINTYIHRLVAEAFIPNPDNLPIINHKNEIRTDNRPENLEWCTHKYNANYGTRNEKISKINKGKLLNDNRRKVVQVDNCGNTIIEFESVTSAAKYFNLSSSNICKIIRRKRKSKYNLVYL